MMNVTSSWASGYTGDWPSSRLALVVAGTAAGVGVATYVGYKLLALHRQLFYNKIFPPEIVVIHKFGPCTTAPCKSPFPLKLETYLRLAKIPYETVCSNKRSPKGKIPWLSHNGVDIGDSQFCIEYFNEEFKVDLNKGMSEQNKAVARALRIMAEDSLFWYIVLDRNVYQSNPAWSIDLPIPKILMIPFVSRCTKMAKMHGMGRHTKDEVYQITMDNVAAVSVLLGNKPFLFGDHPVEDDCAVFGQLAIIYYILHDGVVSDYIKDKLPNIVAYLERMKALAWPDWNESLAIPSQ